MLGDELAAISKVFCISLKLKFNSNLRNKNDIFMMGDVDIGYPYKVYFKIDSKSKSKWLSLTFETFHFNVP